MNRRRFLFGVAASAALAPAIVKAASLMKISVQEPKLWADGVHDDTAALNYFLAKAARNGKPFILEGGIYKTTSSIVSSGHTSVELNDVHFITDLERVDPVIQLGGGRIVFSGCQFTPESRDDAWAVRA